MRSLGQVSNQENRFWMGGRLATKLVEISHDPRDLEDGNFWAVVITFEGEMTFARFDVVEDASFPVKPWKKIETEWASSTSPSSYQSYVQSVMEEISQGMVYQVNSCYVMSNKVNDEPVGLSGLFSELLVQNPAPFAQYLHIPELEIASASPERLLNREGAKVLTSPIKGTMRGVDASFGEKDRAENLMIVDLMRNDLSRICEDGSIEVSDLFRTESHPGLTHLVSDVRGTLRPCISWSEIFASIAPAGSVSGAPKSSALKTISDHEPSARGVYCGAIGWIHGDRGELAVGIRTFWKSADEVLRFGTGAGITWGSNPQSEWEETQLKAERLISIAGGSIKV